LSILAGLNFIRKPAIIAATRMPVPVKDRKLKRKIASSGIGAGVTGGILKIWWWRLLMINEGAKIESSSLFTWGIPQTKMTRLRIIQGRLAEKSAFRFRWVPLRSVFPYSCGEKV